MREGREGGEKERGGEVVERLAERGGEVEGVAERGGEGDGGPHYMVSPRRSNLWPQFLSAHYVPHGIYAWPLSDRVFIRHHVVLRALL